MQPLVSIIIPTFNRVNLLEDTLNSILFQKFTNWECIVVDDGSTDNTTKLLEAYCKKDSRFSHHQRPKKKPKGANACRNYGFEISKGAYIQLLDSDDILEENCLLERIEYISKDDTVDLLIRDTALLIDSIKEYNSINKDPKVINREQYLRMFLRYDLPWHTSSALYKRKLFVKSKFDESLQRFQDVSFNIKVLSENPDLNILRDTKIDSFYRVEKEKKITKAFLCVLMKSLAQFNRIHANLIRNIDYKNDLRVFNMIFFNDYFLKSIKENKKRFFILILSYLKGDIFNLKQKFYILMCFIFYATGTIHQKGLGMYRFNKAYNKVFNSVFS